MAPDVRVERVLVATVRSLRTEVFGAAKLGAKNQIDHLDTTRHWALFVHDDVVGCATVVHVRGLLLRAMAVSPDRQRLGLGAVLMAAVCDEVDAPMWCNARLPAVPFYRALGWTEQGPIFEMKGRGPHQRLGWL